mmetsp:Transcript_47303/g.133050  ORF Transcript_47303/g.133050 Transcript_47303/m.133050 type:complete len:287 (-) Transcript_47303:233-1093(-)
MRSLLWISGCEIAASTSAKSRVPLPSASASSKISWSWSKMRERSRCAAFNDRASSPATVASVCSTTMPTMMFRTPNLAKQMRAKKNHRKSGCTTQTCRTTALFHLSSVTTCTRVSNDRATVAKYTSWSQPVSLKYGSYSSSLWPIKCVTRMAPRKQTSTVMTQSQASVVIALASPLATSHNSFSILIKRISLMTRSRRMNRNIDRNRASPPEPMGMRMKLSSTDENTMAKSKRLENSSRESSDAACVLSDQHGRTCRTPCTRKEPEAVNWSSPPCAGRMKKPTPLK